MGGMLKVGWEEGRNGCKWKKEVIIDHGVVEWGKEIFLFITYL